MELFKQLEYHIWAEVEFYNALSDIDPDKWEIIHPELQKSLQGLYAHKLEVMWFWFQLMKKVEPSDPPNFEKLKKDQLFTLMFNLFDELKEFLNSTEDVELRLDFPWLKEPYQVTIYELLFNILNHHAYHRGQIAIMLKKYNIQFPETDYNPYMYQKLDLLKKE